MALILFCPRRGLSHSPSATRAYTMYLPVRVFSWHRGHSNVLFTNSPAQRSLCEVEIGVREAIFSRPAKMLSCTAEDLYLTRIYGYKR